MKGYEHLADTIEAYVAKRLSKQESEAFEQRMLIDEGLHEAVAMEQSLSSLVLENDLLQLNKKMTVDLASLEKRTKVQRAFFSLLALVTLSAGIYFVFASSKKEENKSVIKKEIVQKEKDKTVSPKSIEETRSTTVFSIKTRSSGEEKKKAPVDTKEVPYAADPKEMPPMETNKNVEVPSVLSNETAKKEASLPSAPVSPCSDKKIEATFISKACQKNHSNGSIEIQLPSSHPTIQYSIDKHHFTPNAHIKHLSAGEHTVYAKEDECIINLGKIAVKSTACVSDYEKTYSPEIDLAWPIPIMEGEAASFRIVDKTGKVAFESLGLEPSGVTWSGNTGNNGPAALGVYKVFIHYPSGESCVSSVTLFR